MTSPEQEIVDRLLEVYGSGRKLVLLFDYDGTLSPIVSHPSLARLPESTRRLMQQLASFPRMLLGVVSGRMISEVKELVGLSDLYYAGTGGQEIDLRGRLVVQSPDEIGIKGVEEATRRLEALASEFPGAWVESKGRGLTLHYRAVAPEFLLDLPNRARQSLERLVEPVRIVQGPMALEISSGKSWTKGSALRMIVDHAGIEAVPLYAGDSGNDAEALEAASSLGGIAVGVGADAPPQAAFRLADPSALGLVLDRFVTAAAAKDHGKDWHGEEALRRDFCTF